jgi:hypothetical protein
MGSRPAQHLPRAGRLPILAKLRPYALGPQVQLVSPLTALGEGRCEHCVQAEALKWAEPFPRRQRYGSALVAAS